MQVYTLTCDVSFDSHARSHTATRQTDSSVLVFTKANAHMQNASKHKCIKQ